MCGIAGYIGKKEPLPERIDLALEKMRNRGPDVRKYRVLRMGENHVALLHSRLSIIDLDDRSNQPFEIDGRTLVFNGEIYNYLELREKLLKEGVVLKTDSDTEVLLHYYIKYGESCVEHFEGMWSFAVYDSVKKKVFMSRDRFGEKPFYYFETPEAFYFGSEVKFIEALSGIKFSVNENQVMRYLVNGYKSLYKQAETFYNDLKELPYASNMSVSEKLGIKISKYWEPAFSEKKMSLEEAVEGTRQNFLESVKLRLRSDVPMAFCLSGGIDSTAIVSTAAKVFNYDVATFSIIDSDERYNEEDNVDKTIKDLGCKNVKIRISHEGTLERLRKLIEYHDMPIATISYLIHSMLSESIASNGYRVVASGTAADELFTGYYDHYNLHLNEIKDSPYFEKALQNWQDHTGKIIRNPYLKNPRLYFEDPGCRKHIYLNNDVFASFLKKDFTEGFIEEKYCNSLLRNRMLNELFHESIPVILHEDDMNSMFYSIENRSPYLDRKLFEFAYSVPPEYLIYDGFNKYPLRQAMEGVINEEVRTDRRKKGFNASINSLVDFDDKVTKDFLLAQSPVYQIVKRECIEEAMTVRPMANSYSKFMFNFINIKLFLEMRAA